MMHSNNVFEMASLYEAGQSEEAREEKKRKWAIFFYFFFHKIFSGIRKN